ncbi:MAG: amidase [SAR202 cluster bacterium]|nr:amidase [SAR202 cluster bacterium]
MRNIVFTSAVKLARAIRQKRVSSVEVVRAHLDRIAEVNPKINAVVQVAAESAMRQAKLADAAVAKGGPLGPLHGVPFSMKDAFETAGVVSTGGTLGRRGYVPKTDATVVARLRAAGGILIGKTNLPEASLAFESDNLVYGRAKNPFDLERTPGGSSGGEAAAVSSGCAALGIGSDNGGSVRVPSHFCGSAGLKPTGGRVPRTGHWPTFPGVLDPLTQAGPMARFVEDVALGLSIVAGPDGRDPHCHAVPLGNYKRVDVSKLRVAFYTDNGVKPPTRETAKTVRAAVKALADAGASVVEKSPPGNEVCRELVYGLFQADAGIPVRETLEAAGTTVFHPLFQGTQKWMASNPMTAVELVRLLARVDDYRSDITKFMEPYDVLLCPVAAFPSTRHGEMWQDDILPGFTYTYPHNLTAWSVAVVRCGTSPEGLPIGVQIAAKAWQDDVALAAAAHLEAALGGWQRPPI